MFRRLGIPRERHEVSRFTSERARTPSDTHALCPSSIVPKDRDLRGRFLRLGVQEDKFAPQQPFEQKAFAKVWQKN